MSTKIDNGRVCDRDQPSHKSVETQTEEPYPTILLKRKDISLWGRYLEANRRQPLITKSLTTGFLTLIGNMSAQYIMISKGKQTHIMMRKVIYRSA